MIEATLETLLLSGAASCWFGWRRRPSVKRTIELHTDGVLYCFDEPENSMAKNMRERLWLLGSRVVDCGTHRGQLCFGLELADASSVEQVRPTGLFTSLRRSASVSSLHAEGTLSRGCLALFFLGDKLLKWRIIYHLRLAALSLPPFSQEKNRHLIFSTTDGSLEAGGGSGVYRLLQRPPRVIDATGDDPLEMHEVEQLEDVLRRYEAQKQLIQESDEEQHEEASLHDFTVADEDEKLGVPERLVHSPLYVPCIASKPANQACADCGEKWPTWALLRPFGCFVCINCVGVHRQLWPQRCREVQLDNWSAADIDFMIKHGNDVVNDHLEYGGFFIGGGKAVYKPMGSFSQPEVREEYITLKYDGAFTRERNPHVLQAVPPPSDLDVEGNVGLNQNGALTHDGPPRYIGVAYISVREVDCIRSSGAVLSLTNGFQEVRSRAGVVPTDLHNACTRWEESFQLGVYSVTAPLYIALYTSSDKLLGVAEWTLPDGVAAVGGISEPVTVPLIWCSPDEGSTWPLRNVFGGERHRWQRTSRDWRQPALYLNVSFAHFG
ncbi:GTP-ase activating protein [Trypanosoma rangeli SC58]|uniref:GTP-ase activating protein n=1 Tax=Trypanosoma rangeli SC58 TaxID=429131 RepID=A0A061J2N8_TRYRA|nr:GTP-ase activating protein [Trypanosoma rangeli SC58]